MHQTPRLRSLLLCIAVLAAVLALAPAASAQQPVTFSKSFNPATIGPGSVSTLQFNIANASGLPVENLAFTDNLPTGVTLASPANPQTTCGGTVNAPNGGGTIGFAGGSVGGSSSCSISVDVTASTPATHTNVSGNLTYGEAGNAGTATADLTVVSNRPGFRKSFSPSSIVLGGRSTLTFTIDNSANPSPADQLSFTDTLPVGMVVANPANASKTCSGGVITAAPGSGVIMYASSFGFPGSNASVAANSICTLSVDVVGNAVGLLDNVSGELRFVQGTTTLSCGKASATLEVSADPISLRKSFTDDPAPPGGTVDLQFTIRNLTRDSTATDIAFTDDLDAALTGLEAVGLPLADPCGPGSELAGTDLLSLTGGNLDPEGVCTFSVALQVPAGAASGVYTNTTSAVTADVAGSPATGAAATDLLFVEPAPALTKDFLDDPVGAGGSVVLEFTITNTSTSHDATDIAFEDVFGTELPTGSSIPADGFCGPGSTATFTPRINPMGSDATPARLEVSGASLDPGATCTFSIELDVDVGAKGGTSTNTTSEITATVDGQELTGKPATDDLEIVAGVSLSKEFTDDPAPAGGTATLAFTLSHDDDAPGDATAIAFTDDLDATLSGLAATGLPLADVCGAGSQLSGTSTLSFTGGSLAIGESCTFSATLDVPATAPTGKHPNTTSTVVATVTGLTTLEQAATDDLRIAGLTLTKEFTDDPVLPGSTVTLEFRIENVSTTQNATDIFFQDDLDDVLDNLVATGLPLNDVCGTGSSLTGAAGNTLLTFNNGALAIGESCTFSVVLQVPVAAEPDTYVNATSGFSATVGGSTVLYDNARDELTIASEFLALTKEFTDDPVGPGEAVNLRFTLTNLDPSSPASDIAFTDDLDAALAGLVATGLPIAACGGTASGTDTISFSGGSLAAGATCSFDVSLSVPATVTLGSTAVNTTSQVTGTIGGLGVTGDPATDVLRIDFLTFSKAFGGAVFPGETVSLSFTIHNLSATDPVTDLSFSDDLSAVIPGLEAIGLPASDVCGTGSLLAGTSFLTLTGGNLLPGGSCTFSVTLQVPAAAAPGDYLNVTSDLRQFAAAATQPATATLTVLEVVDSDGDGVLDDVDVCPGTVIPEGVPTESLGTNRYALVDGDGIFDTTAPKGKGPGEVFTVEDTAGCSCEQIIEALHLGEGHRKFGCSLGAMRNWVALVNP